MIKLAQKINDDYGWELVLFYKYRQFSDGLTIFEKRINWDRYLGDHSPKFEIYLAVFNITIIEFNIYYLHHRNVKE